MDCSDFLDRYSDFRDGLLSAREEGVFRTHLAECGTCARHDAAVKRGVELLLRMGEIRPSPDFGARLRHRLMGSGEGAEKGVRWVAARGPSTYPFLRP